MTLIWLAKVILLTCRDDPRPSLEGYWHDVLPDQVRSVLHHYQQFSMQLGYPLLNERLAGLAPSSSFYWTGSIVHPPRLRASVTASPMWLFRPVCRFWQQFFVFLTVSHAQLGAPMFVWADWLVLPLGVLVWYLGRQLRKGKGRRRISFFWMKSL